MALFFIDIEKAYVKHQQHNMIFSYITLHFITNVHHHLSIVLSADLTFAFAFNSLGMMVIHPLGVAAADGLRCGRLRALVRPPGSERHRDTLSQVHQAAHAREVEQGGPRGVSHVLGFDTVCVA